LEDSPSLPSLNRPDPPGTNILQKGGFGDLQILDIYFKKVGLEIFKYSIASSVVKTSSFSIKDIELPPFVLIFIYLKQNICREVFEYYLI